MPPEYRKPISPYIGSSPLTASLYECENKVTEWLQKSAGAFADVTRGTSVYPGDDLYRQQLPEALYTLFEGLDSEMVRVTIEAWLEKNPKDD